VSGQLHAPATLCSKLFDQSKQAKLQWLQNSGHMYGDNLNKVRHETSKTFRNKKWEYLKKIDEHEPFSKDKNIRDLYRDIN